MNRLRHPARRAPRLALAALLVLALVPALRPAQAQDKVGTTAAPFLGIGVGARAMGMGGAQVASAAGPSALYWNPSAITAMPAHGFEFTHTEWFVGSTIEHAALVLDLDGMGHVGVSALVLDYGEMEVNTIANPDGTGELFSPQDLAVAVSYARALTDRFALGASVKYIRQRIWNESASGAAVDLGVTYRAAFQNLRIGMTMTNFGSSMKMDGKDLRQAIDIDPDAEGNNDRLAAFLETDDWSLPLAFTVGVAMDAFQAAGSRLTVSVDAAAPADNSQSANVGVEYAFRDIFFLRGGYRQAFAAVAEDGGWTAGAGLRYEIGGRLAGYADYVYQQHDVFDGPQMFTLGVTF